MGSATKTVLIIFLDEEMEESDDVLTKCFCGIDYYKKDLGKHVILVHEDVLPSKEWTQACFNNSYKCCFCYFQNMDEGMRRYHLFNTHKDKLQAMSEMASTEGLQYHDQVENEGKGLE